MTSVKLCSIAVAAIGASERDGGPRRRLKLYPTSNDRQSQRQDALVRTQNIAIEPGAQGRGSCNAVLFLFFQNAVFDFKNRSYYTEMKTRVRSNEPAHAMKPRSEVLDIVRRSDRMLVSSKNIHNSGKSSTLSNSTASSSATCSCCCTISKNVIGCSGISFHSTEAPPGPLSV